MLDRLRWGFLGLAVIVVTGITGYMAIEGWSLLDASWMVLITLTTIGYSEVHKLSAGGKIFTMGLVVLGVSLGGYVASQVTRYVIRGEMQDAFRARRRRKRMKSIRNHHIVVGMGRLGQEVAAELRHAGREVVVVDQNPEVLSDWPDQEMVIVGDGASDDILNAAGVAQAQGLAVATPHSAVNVYVTLSARHLNPELPIMVRADETDAIPKAMRAGATAIISPYGLGGNRMARCLLHPAATHFIDQAVTRHSGELALEDVPVGSNKSFHGRLADIALGSKYQVIVVAIRKQDGVFRPTPDAEERVGEGDILVVTGKPENIQSFSDAVMPS